MKESIKARRLRNWKARQIAEGYDVSKVNTLEEAEHFFDKKAEESKAKTKKELLEEALSLGLELSNKLKNSEIEEAINIKKAELQEEEKEKTLKEITELEVQSAINVNEVMDTLTDGFAVGEENDGNVHVRPVVNGEIIDTPVEKIEIPVEGE